MSITTTTPMTAKFDMPIVAELCTTLRARGPNAVAVIREEE